MSMRFCVLSAVLVLALSAPAFSQPTPPMSNIWVPHAPTAAQAMKDARGDRDINDIDTAARQAGALLVLIDAVETWENVMSRRRLSPGAAAKLQEYQHAHSALIDKLFISRFNADDKTCKGDACLRKRFYDGQSGYAFDPSFKRSVLSRYFPSGYIAAAIPPQVAPPEPQKASDAIESSRKDSSLWEKQLPSVWLVDFDTYHFFGKHQQAVERAATLGILNDAVSTFSIGVGASYTMPSEVKEKLAAYVAGIKEAFDSACPPKPAVCTTGIFVDEENLRGDPNYKYRVLSRFFAPELIQAATAARTPGLGGILYTPAFPSVAHTTTVWTTGIVAAWLAFWLLWARKGLRRARVERKRKANNEKAMAQFGATPEERSQRIERAFDARAGDIKFDLNENGIVCHFFRSLSAMGAREREVLRVAYHLYNLGLARSETNFYLMRFGLVYAEGKATITGDWKIPPNHPRISSIGDALTWYEGSDHLEAMLNLALDTLQSAIKRNPDIPILRKLSARLYGDGGDLVPGAPLKSGAKGEPVKGGLVLGLDEKSADTWWYHDGEGSLITVAPPGSGKTQSQVLPNLLMWKGAAVVLDVKGEIYAQTSKWRRDNVGPVYKFSPLDPGSSHGYNPLTLVRADTEYLWEDARLLAEMMIVPSGAKDPFWDDRARDVVTAAIAYVCIEQDVAKRSMADVLDIVHGVGWTAFIAYLEARVDFKSMMRMGHSLASIEPKLLDSVLQNAQSRMSAWSGERIARATRKSDWSPLDLRGGTNPTIYICLKPNEVDSYISILRVIIAQHIRALTALELLGHGEHPILFMLDELPRLKYMPPVEEALEIGRQYGLKLWLFAQSLGQLEGAYTNADGMIGGCAVRMFMNPGLHDGTAQKVSDDIGFQESIVDGTRVKIVEPNVIAGPAFKDVVIIMAANARAARLNKYFAYQDDTLKNRMGSV